MSVAVQTEALKQEGNDQCKKLEGGGKNMNSYYLYDFSGVSK